MKKNRCAEIFINDFKELKNHKIVNDIELVLNNTNKEGNKIALIAGTGSNCYGINDKTKATAKSGGLEYVLSDQGSGYWIGLQALRKVIKSYDRRGEKTVLEKYIFDRYKIHNTVELKQIIYTKEFSKNRYAEITLDVVKCAIQEKDTIARNILKKASHELFLHVRGVATNLKLEDFSVIASGSIFKIKYVKEHVEKELLFYYDNVNIEYPSRPSFYGGLNIYKCL